MDISAVNHSVVPVPVAPLEHSAEHRDVVHAVKAVNATEMFGHDNELMFHMDRQAHRMVVQVVNRQTKEVISQIPAEYVLRLGEDLQVRTGDD